jgi:hypothetical protein
LKQKHEYGERFLHYLQQTNAELAICIYNKLRDLWKWNEISTILIFHWRYRMCVVICESSVSIFVNGLLTVCNYGYSFSRGCNWYYWHSVSFFRHELQKSKDLKKNYNVLFCDPTISRFQRNLLIRSSV